MILSPIYKVESVASGIDNTSDTNEYWVDLTRGSDVSGDGKRSKPFKTPAACMRFIGQPNSAEDFKQKLSVHVASCIEGTDPAGGGQYDGDVDIPHRPITFYLHGVRWNGNVTYWQSDAREYETPSADMRACPSFIGVADSRDAHPRLRNGFQLSGNFRIRNITGVITNISGDGVTITVQVASDSSLTPNMRPGLYIKISGTAAYNGNYIVNSRINDNTFTILGSGTGTETSGAYVETDSSFQTSNAKDVSFENTYIVGTFTADDGIVNGGAPTVGATIVYTKGFRIYGAIEGRTITMHKIVSSQFDNTITVASFTDVHDCYFKGNITALTSTVNFGWTHCKFDGILFQFNPGQTILVDLITNTSMVNNVTWTNIPSFTYLEDPTLVGDSVERVSRTLYISPTGSDVTGTGTSGNPYFSLHRAIRNIKPVIDNCTITISAAAGTYDFSALGNFQLRNITILNAGRIRIRPNADINSWYSVAESGTFSAQLDTNSPIHTDTGKAWSTDALAGKFLLAKTMNSGSLPSNGDGTNYTYRVSPINRNGSDWLEAAFFGGAIGQSQDVATYDIVDIGVMFNFGAYSFTICPDIIGTLLINRVGFTFSSTGSFVVGEYTATLGLASWGDLAQSCFIYNCSINAYSIVAVKTNINCSYVQTSFSSDIGDPWNCVWRCSYNSAYSKVNIYRDSRDMIWYNNSGNYQGYFIWFQSEAKHNPYFSYRHKFINTKSCIMILEELHATSLRLYLETVDFFHWVQKNHQIIYSYDDSIVFVNEPALGRITADGTTVSTIYHDLNRTFNVTIWDAGTRINVRAASQLDNDSSWAGSSIKDALNNIQSSTLPIAAFNGTSRISVGAVAPATPNVGDIWIDTGNTPPVVFTADGGIAVKCIAGENLYKGEIVSAIQGGTNGQVLKTPISGNENDMPYGVVYADATTGSEVLVVVAGIAKVLPEASLTAAIGYHISTSTTTAGRVAQSATVPAATVHFREVGHWLDNGTGAGIITRAIIHFN